MSSKVCKSIYSNNCNYFKVLIGALTLNYSKAVKIEITF